MPKTVFLEATNGAATVRARLRRWVNALPYGGGSVTHPSMKAARSRGTVPCVEYYARSRPRMVPVEEANLSVSKAMRWSMETNMFGSG